MSNTLMKILSQVSTNINCKAFNDCSGDTISRRTARGLTRYQGNDSEEYTTANIAPIHGLMLGSLLLVKSENNNTKLVGAIAFASLFGLYHKGKDN